MSSLALRKRIAALEAARQIVTSDYEVTIRGGLPGAERIAQAISGPRTWRRDDGEDEQGFRRRVWREARAEGLSCVVFGGMPG